MRGPLRGPLRGSTDAGHCREKRRMGNNMEDSQLPLNKTLDILEIHGPLRHLPAKDVQCVDVAETIQLLEGLLPILDCNTRLISSVLPRRWANRTYRAWILILP